MRFGALCRLVVGLIAVSSSAKAGESWQPVHPVEFVVMDYNGGSSDTIAKLIYTLIVKYNLTQKPFYFTYMPEKAGMNGIQYILSAKDPDHTILFTSDSFFTTMIQHGGQGLDILSLAPLAQLAEEPLVLSVAASHKNLGSLLEFSEQARSKKPWLMVGGIEDSQQDFLNTFLNAAFENNAVYVAIGSGEDAASIVERGAADSSLGTISDQLDLIKAGKLKPLVAFSEKRLPKFPEVPAFRESSWDITAAVTRSVAGAPGMSAPARAYYTNLLKQVFETPEWRDIRASRCMTGTFLAGEELRAAWRRRVKGNYLLIAMALLIKE
jgi:tripartite-type tricarboxylate transporter receptor subunit TctC